MPPKRTNERETENQSAHQPIQPDSLDEHASNTEFKTVFTTLSSSFVAQNEWPATIPANLVANVVAVRI